MLAALISPLLFAAMGVAGANAEQPASATEPPASAPTLARLDEGSRDAKARSHQDRRTGTRAAHECAETDRAVSNGKPEHRRKYRALVSRIASRNGLDPALLHAVIAAESGYNPRSVNPKSGAAGLMQIMPHIAREHGVTDVFDPEQNVRAGAKHFAELMETFDGDHRLALAAYHAGEPTVRKAGGIPPYRSTQQYVPKVMKYYNRFRCAT
jgi:soluble lytic murein transglycosylase-like protein